MTCDYAESIAFVRSLLDKAIEIAEARPGGHTQMSWDHRWHVSKVLAMAEHLVISGPFRPGDRVVLTKTPEITPEKSWGWMGAKHYLIEGSKGIIRNVDFSADDKSLLGYVEFDDETWIDKDGVKHPPREKHVYCFGARWLSRIEEEVDG